MKFDTPTIVSAATRQIVINPQTSVDKTSLVILEAPVRVAGRLFFKGSIAAYSYVRFVCRVADRTESIGRY
ncbi:hypothetical protein [Pararhizobium antarcticum]|uniref:Uncharacterized protein n=1 Tax=Pararhizobium antarcticum TaxID=1798805 RepID=A0A657LUA6_9HYPH|nr:hypothetical protein [Pararhizobium antarcticum]OJF98713.1 hypothetical protein AX760_01325 [Pararhizobium antarcticum]OJF98899.1 hypothetical protein AX760_02485 [Pararhizobium antarcticum]OJF99134.1 hypothetical protein AX761_11755 [Rhizobium sp. 58]